LLGHGDERVRVAILDALHPAQESRDTPRPRVRHLYLAIRAVDLVDDHTTEKPGQ